MPRGYHPPNNELTNNRGGKGVSNDNTIYLGKVVSLSDDIFDDYRIKVRINGIDDKVTNNDLPFCDPFLPKFLNIIPKRGEWVKILFFNTRNKFQHREWIGPIISQPHKLKKEDSDSAFSTQQLTTISPDTSDKVLPDAKGVNPDREEISLLGRDNTDIIQREKEIVLRAGKHEIDNNLKLNKKNPSFIHQKISNDGKISTSNIIADKINLITHDGSPTFRGMVKDKTSDDITDMFSGKITDKIQKQINENSHSLVFADKMVEFIELIKKYMVEHSHPYNGGGINENSPGWDTLQKILKFDLNEGNFRSKNIKIN